MRLPSALSRPMMDHLGTTYFNQVWNAPDDHGRANFPLLKAAERLQTGAIPVGRSMVGLPTIDSAYAVYTVSAQAFGRFIDFAPYVWIKDTDILIKDYVQISTYGANGRVIPTGTVWLRYNPVTAMVLVAISRTYTSSCIGEIYPSLYMTIYFDTTRNTPTITQLYTVSQTTPSAVVTQAIQTARTQYPAGTMLYVNGWVYAPDQAPGIKLNDIVQIICDPDMIGYCELAIDDNKTGYYSDKYKEYREILHIPKALNPSNVTITNDTLSVVVFDPITGRGVYGHQIAAHALESITHNDFSVSRNALQVFQNVLGASSVSVRLHVRYPTDPQTLTDETNHLKSLYTFSDDDIKKQLVGMASGQIAEWKAANLEKSLFLDFLYKFDSSTDNLLERYSSAMGYYSVASTLGESMHYYTYKGGEVTIAKPARLINFPCRALVYADGRKLPDQFINLKNRGDSLELGFKPGSYVSQGTRIGVYITEEGSHTPILYTPTADYPTITVSHDDYRLVEVTTYTTPKQILGGTTSKGYRVISVSPGDYTTTLNLDGSVTYKTGTGHYNSTFYLVPICGLSTKIVDLDPILSSKDSIVIPLDMVDTDNGYMPLLGREMIEIYINGYRLIEDIDYSCTFVEDPDGNVLQRLLTISNQEYTNLAQSGNVLEVITHSDEVVSVDKGYAIANKLYRKLPEMAWDPSVGRAFVRGRLVERVNEVATTLVSQETLEDGSPYLLEWTVPYGVKKLMAAISPINDRKLRTKIQRLLKQTTPDYPSVVTISDQYALYSPYLARIVKDVGTGAFTIIDEVKDDAFLNQFSAYHLLYERDVILAKTNPLLDRRFVTIAAHYVNFSVQDPKQMVLVQRLISLTLLPAQLAINEVLV